MLPAEGKQPRILRAQGGRRDVGGEPGSAPLILDACWSVRPKQKRHVADDAYGRYQRARRRLPEELFEQGVDLEVQRLPPIDAKARQKKHARSLFDQKNAAVVAAHHDCCLAMKPRLMRSGHRRRRKIRLRSSGDWKLHSISEAIASFPCLTKGLIAWSPKG